jgi:DNA gyrase inhibitor GyrI
VRDRRIKSLETANRNMRAELRHLREWRRTSGVPDRGGMTLATYRKIAMALHPDRQPAEAERADACKAFTAWSSSLKEAAAKERQ